MRSPIKYLDNKFLIFLNDFFIRLLCSFFTKENVICSSSWLSFSKKKLMNKTENKPIVKLLSHPMSTFKKSGSYARRKRSMVALQASSAAVSLLKASPACAAQRCTQSLQLLLAVIARLKPSIISSNSIREMVTS